MFGHQVLLMAKNAQFFFGFMEADLLRVLHKNYLLMMAKILLIEDDDEMSATVAKWLSLEHHAVEIARTGPSGLDLVLGGGFDVALHNNAALPAQGA